MLHNLGQEGLEPLGADLPDVGQNGDDFAFK
jgi:hypothetical protein